MSTIEKQFFKAIIDNNINLVKYYLDLNIEIPIGFSFYPFYTSIRGPSAFICQDKYKDMFNLLINKLISNKEASKEIIIDAYILCYYIKYFNTFFIKKIKAKLTFRINNLHSKRYYIYLNSQYLIENPKINDIILNLYDYDDDHIHGLSQDNIKKLIQIKNNNDINKLENIVIKKIIKEKIKYNKLPIKLINKINNEKEVINDDNILYKTKKIILIDYDSNRYW